MTLLLLGAPQANPLAIITQELTAIEGEAPTAALQTAVPPLVPTIKTVEQPDFVNRLSGLIPQSWFNGNDGTPVFNAVLNGAAFPLTEIYALFRYGILQNRIGTATGIWLDRIAYDFLGPGFPRRSWVSASGTTAYESDASFRARIIEQIIAPKATRGGIDIALTNLTGKVPQIIEPFNPNDCASYGEVSYYGQVGVYGSLLCNNQIFITAYRPAGEGIPNVAGYSYGYYGAGNTSYIDLSEITGQVLDSDIYASGADTVAAGVVCWMEIEDAVKPIPTLLNLNFSQSINSQNLIPWFTG